MLKCLYCGSDKFNINISVYANNESMQNKTLDDLFKEAKEDVMQGKKGYIHCSECKTNYNNEYINIYLNAINDKQVASEDFAYLLRVKFEQFLKREDIYAYNENDFCYKSLNILNEKLKDFDVVEFSETKFDITVKYFKDNKIRTFTTSKHSEKIFKTMFVRDRLNKLNIIYNSTLEAIQLINSGDYFVVIYDKPHHIEKKEFSKTAHRIKQVFFG